MKRLLIIILLLNSMLVMAAPANTIYQAFVPVADRSIKLRQAAFSAAFDQVIVKVTGVHNVLQNEQIAKARTQAESLVRSFGYQACPDQADKKCLAVTFAPAAMSSLVRKAKLSLWESHRPRVMVWLLVEENGEKYVVTHSRPESLAVADAAKQFALPVVLPMMDLQDLSTVNIEQLADLDATHLQKASQRYPHDAMLVGKLDKVGDEWNIDWQLSYQGATMPYKQTSPATSAAIMHIMMQVSRELSQSRHVKQVADKHHASLALHIEGVNDLDDYADLIAYLKHLTPVSKVVADSFDPEQLVIKVKL